MVINNEKFLGTELRNRAGTQQDEGMYPYISTAMDWGSGLLQFVSHSCDTEALRTVFSQLGFDVKVHNNLTAEAMRQELKKLGSRNFLKDDVLVSSVTHLQSCHISYYSRFFNTTLMSVLEIKSYSQRPGQEIVWYVTFHITTTCHFNTFVNKWDTC